MPPKKSKIPLTLRFKRKTQTVFVSIDKDATVLQLKKQLCAMINETGGLVVDIKPDVGATEDDIPIPKPSFATSSSDEEEDTKVSKASGVQVAPGKLKVAKPKNKSDIYGGAVEDLENDKEIVGTICSDYDVILFALQDEEYDVFEPAQVEVD